MTPERSGGAFAAPLGHPRRNLVCPRPHSSVESVSTAAQSTRLVIGRSRVRIPVGAHFLWIALASLVRWRFSLRHVRTTYLLGTCHVCGTYVRLHPGSDVASHTRPLATRSQREDESSREGQTGRRTGSRSCACRAIVRSRGRSRRDTSGSPRPDCGADLRSDGRRKKLAAAWRKYRTAPVHQVVLDQTAKSGRIDLRRFKKR
jgi:hypothetical protein